MFSFLKNILWQGKTRAARSHSSPLQQRYRIVRKSQHFDYVIDTSENRQIQLLVEPFYPRGERPRAVYTLKAGSRWSDGSEVTKGEIEDLEALLAVISTDSDYLFSLSVEGGV